MKFPLSLTFALFLGVLSSSSHARECDPGEAARHIIVVNRGGQPMRPTVSRQVNNNGKFEYKVALGQFPPVPEGDPTEYEKYLRELIKDIDRKGNGRIMFFIHGGMNFATGAAERAARFIDNECEGVNGYTNLSAQGYPIFICWDSPPTGYVEQVAYVRAGKTERYGRSVGHKAFAMLTLPFQLVADFGRGIARFPAELSQFAHNDLYVIAPGLFSEYKKMQDETSYLRGQPNQKGISISPMDRIDVSLVEPPKMPSRYLEDLQTAILFPIRTLSLPILDSIGVGAWDNMLRHTETMFDRTDTETRGHPTPVEEAVQDDQTGAIALFFSKLNEANDARKAKHLPPYKITLIGHSMGTIIANRIINSYPNLKYSNVIYMGAACSVREFEASVLPYLARAGNENSEFYGLSLHPRCEAGEIAFSPGKFSVDAAPRGSLPVWIDNIFAHPPSEGQRRYGIFQTAVLASHNIPHAVRNQVHLKCFAFGAVKSDDGLIRCPQHHADFGDAPFWDPAFWKVEEAPKPGAKRSHPELISKQHVVSRN